jgi:two-component system response regulator AtoC
MERAEEGFSERPEIVILDIRLPGMDGLEVLRRIREAGEDIHVIMITAYHDAETTKQAMKLGAYEYIHKPLDADEFEVAIERAVNNLLMRWASSKKSGNQKGHRIMNQHPFLD